MNRILIAVLPLLLLTACAGDETTAPPLRPPPGTELVDVSANATVTVLMSGLDAPRGLAWGPEGGLYVAEAGSSEINGPCATVARGNNCYSGTGAVSRWYKGEQERIATGLPSAFNTDFSDIIGPQDIGFQGRRAFVTIGWGGDPAARAQLGGLAAGLGWLLQVTPNGKWHEVADVAAVERRQNPAGGPFDSNPFGLLVEPGTRFVADAGGNSLVQVNANGRAAAVATFPATPAPPPFGQADAVPTEVQRGPDGALYVSTLSGVPFLPGDARIYRVAPGGTPTVHAGGFTAVTDFDIADDGSLYVLEYASGIFLTPPGRVVRVAPGGTRTVITDALTNPTGILVGPDGAIYVSNLGNLPEVGEVLKIVP
jgi:glucose/arabinose dehydrogenase